MSRYDYDYNSYPRYVSAAEKRKKAESLARKMSTKGSTLEPAIVKGTKLASSFWGQSWNRNLESYQAYENRLPRGRSYVRNGAVIDLKVEKGCIKALVSGSELYTVTINIQPLNAIRWKSLKSEISGQISSLIGLLQGKIPPSVMAAVTRQGEGLFPDPKDIRFICSCPDYAEPCKHSAAAIYGVGARLDEKPELLFLLRGVDHIDLIDSASDAAAAQADSSGAGEGLDDLAGIFGIDLEPMEAAAAPLEEVAAKEKPGSNAGTPKKKAAKKKAKPTAKKSGVKKVASKSKSIW